MTEAAAAALQAMDRAHRLGQKRAVNVYRVLTRGTLEERIMGLQAFKLDVAATVVSQANASMTAMDTGRLLDLLSSHAGVRWALALCSCAPYEPRWI